MYIPVPSLVNYSSHVILEISTISGGFIRIYTIAAEYSQHTPMIELYICIFGSILQVHNCSPMLTEQCSLQRFGEVVTGHFLCGAVFDADLLLLDAVSD